jgi:hypothetical protein
VKVIVVDGLRFVRDETRGYYRNDRLRKYLHRYLYEAEYGELPSNIHVHHIDHDKTNNSLDNLVAITAEEHMSHHGLNASDEHKERRRRNINEVARPAAIEWHGSEAGREWHRQHYEKHKNVLREAKPQACRNCGEHYQAVRPGYCSNACKSAYRRALGLDNITLICPICGETFETNKYNPAETCSRSCANRMRSRNGQRR